jgi:uncharacterized protein with HEPN domain
MNLRPATPSGNVRQMVTEGMRRTARLVVDVVWNTVTRDLPKLQESVTGILAELDSGAEDSR